MSDQSERPSQPVQPVTFHVAAKTEMASVSSLFVEFAEMFGSFDGAIDQVADRLGEVASSGGEFLIAKDGESQMLAFIQQRYRYSAWEAGLTAYVEDVYVREHVRRQGIGRKLTEFALSRARERDCRSISLYTSSGNRQAMELYEGMGFTSPTARYPDAPSYYYSREL